MHPKTSPPNFASTNTENNTNLFLCDFHFQCFCTLFRAQQTDSLPSLLAPQACESSTCARGLPWFPAAPLASCCCCRSARVFRLVLGCISTRSFQGLKCLINSGNICQRLTSLSENNRGNSKLQKGNEDSMKRKHWTDMHHSVYISIPELEKMTTKRKFQICVKCSFDASSSEVVVVKSRN